ncbi:TonB-dependent receptor family protein [Methylicorpusculum sp.]|uniref:TonB-dependent receptor family protein n=1 Tax=Methylicorpusculum sp. TaxID=2713644 RepID=UPI002ABAAE27|nr:TonB-dependent receptor [Methylicorpusculum sp.]MDZ4151638.1 TonB-dependent receptor plug domain-containing protein [Methylicorpusculum sp.]
MLQPNQIAKALGCALPILIADFVHAADDKTVLQMPVVEIVGADSSLKNMAGSVNILTQEELFKSHVFNVNEALRKIPGVNVRDEEGFGMRPNIGIRGMNPTRSTKTLLLEDGIPLSYAPYGDNASYYHPPIERFASIEVLKGPEQIKFGPQTISGTINYLTPNPPSTPSGSLGFTGGSRDFYDGQFNYGGTWGDFGGLVDITHKESKGARDNTHSDINDFNIKGVYDVDSHNSLTLRANYFQEDSQVTYSGITDAEMRNFGIRYNPFKNDTMKTDRWGTSLTHQLSFNDDVMLTTNAYWSHFHRDWWRQASTTTDNQCGFTNARAQGLAINPDSCNSTQGRLRDYYSYGVEPRLHVNHRTLGIDNELDMGFRAHFEEQYRTQENAKPLGGATTISEKNERDTEAYSGFVQNKFILGDFSLTPGVRIEHVNFSRTDELKSVGGKTSLTEVLPAFGTTYSPNEKITTFFGFHGGFSPPRVEDAISNTGTIIDVGPEKSWNYEVGIRTKPYTGAKLDAALFRADFQQQNSVGSIAGGSTPLATGEALYEGAELLARQDFGPLFASDHNVYFQAAYTWVATAEMTSAFRCLGSTSDCNGVTARELANGAYIGNRLPYSPEHNLTATIGYSHPSGFDIHLETVYVGKQFSDFMNLKDGMDHPDTTNNFRQGRSGQFGQIDDFVVLNVATTYHVKPINTDFFVSLKNLLDETYIVDRTRGILPGAPRLIQAGFKVNF